MLERLGHAWRVFGTALSFAAFGLGGVLLGLLVFPLLRLGVRDRARLGRLARRLVQASFAGHVWLMRRLGVMSWEIHGAERLRRPGLLVLANHPTLIDVVCLIGMIEEADCVVKSRLATNPFTRGPLRAAGYIFNDNGAGLIQDCIDSVRSGKNLVIFPEGTRTPRGEVLGPLQRGAANIAIRGALDVTPVTIRCTPPTLGKGEKWYRVPSRRFHMRIEVLPDIPVAPFLAGSAEALAARRLTEHLETTFKTELHRAGAGS
ncbi:lysophospholipid acyltransferase family protein [Arenimonas sp.]|uniref:lysophospholipid acyltransferase family protein n=1 Tax=Arenimonas sp. TaxID=1872635 RepID=UPI0025BC0A22|nr:lysophospholipid acyltransferase family protein [Arenimonas sp.]